MTEAPDAGNATQDNDSGAVERKFSCTLCGFPMTHEAARLQTTIRTTCYNCGEWTLQAADLEEMIAAAEAVAEEIAGEVVTERQALAYLLRDVLEIDRETAAEAMESSPSNVDNLERRAAEKIDDAKNLIESLERVTATTEE